MYSVPTVNSTAMASLHSYSFRSHSDGSDNESSSNDGDNGENSNDNHNTNIIVNNSDLQRTNGLSRVVTTEHTMSSSQSSLSQSDEPEEETPLKGGTDESTVGDETVVDTHAESSTVRSREKEKENEEDKDKGKDEKKNEEEGAHKKVSWQQSPAGGPPTAQDGSPESHRQEKSRAQSQTKVESLDIATFPTDKLLEMLTALLDKIVKSNDRLMDTNFAEQQQQEQQQQQNACVRSVLSFRGKHVPQIGLEQYFQRIQKYCPTSNDVFLSLLVYFDRISRRCNSNSHSNSHSNHEKHPTTPPASSQQFVMDSHNIHRLLIAGTTVSTKFFSDFFYSNSRYARVGGISLQELNHLELQFLILCDFKLLISVNEMQQYADLLYRFWNNSRPHQQPLQPSK